MVSNVFHHILYAQLFLCFTFHVICVLDFLLLHNHDIVTVTLRTTSQFNLFTIFRSGFFYREISGRRCFLTFKTKNVLAGTLPLLGHVDLDVLMLLWRNYQETFGMTIFWEQGSIRPYLVLLFPVSLPKSCVKCLRER